MAATSHGVPGPDFLSPGCAHSRHERCLFFEGYWWWVCQGCGVGWREEYGEFVIYKLAAIRNHEEPRDYPR